MVCSGSYVIFLGFIMESPKTTSSSQCPTVRNRTTSVDFSYHLGQRRTDKCVAKNYRAFPERKDTVDNDICHHKLSGLPDDPENINDKSYESALE
jgi:hypothetical protein